MIRAREVVQAGDIFLIRAECPGCAGEFFEGFPLKHCPNCSKALDGFEIALGRRRCLAGSARKHRYRIGKAVIQRLHVAQDGLCAYCCAKLEPGKYQVEHIIPLAAGGTNGAQNLCLACKPCNHVAGSRCFSTFAAKRDAILTARALGRKSVARL